MKLIIIYSTVIQHALIFNDKLIPEDRLNSRKEKNYHLFKIKKMILYKK